jgi:UDP-N-acetylglucosamine 4,6-dehydratase/5-epimerase
MFDKKTILITGGTGSFGEAMIRILLKKDVKEIRIFSRDEKKQHDLRLKFSNEKLNFFIGDVRDRSSIDIAMRGVDYVFHAAALKQVPSCEFFPMEAVKTNILGTKNCIDSAKYYKVQKIVCLSTDKAAYPINSMGISKALMEKVAISESRDKNSETKIIVTRYGNVLGSRGSVVPLFISQIKNKGFVTITNPNMTRFLMTLDEAVKLVIYAFENGNQGDIFVQKSPSTTVENLFLALKKMLKEDRIEKRIIGLRHGEKIYETLCTSQEMNKSIDEGDFFRIPSDTRDLNYSIYFENGYEVKEIQEFNSENALRLNTNQTIKVLNKSKEVMDEIKKLN